jgi:predicted transcriptional regulator
MMKNNPFDVTSLLTELMERLTDETLTDDKLNEEINRSKAVADLSGKVLSVWGLQLRVAEARDAALNPESFERQLPGALKL